MRRAGEARRPDRDGREGAGGARACTRARARACVRTHGPMVRNHYSLASSSPGHMHGTGLAMGMHSTLDRRARILLQVLIIIMTRSALRGGISCNYTVF